MEIGETIVKLETLKISARLNIQKLIEEHHEALNSDKDSGTTVIIESLDKLGLTLEGGKGDVMEIGEQKDIIMKQLKALRKGFNEQIKKQRKQPKLSKYFRKNLNQQQHQENQHTVQLVYTQII